MHVAVTVGTDMDQVVEAVFAVLGSQLAMVEMGCFSAGAKFAS